jgi:hypothetical protein
MTRKIVVMAHCLFSGVFLVLKAFKKHLQYQINSKETGCTVSICRNYKMQDPLCSLTLVHISGQLSKLTSIQINFAPDI